jgi:hypothetical protein
MSRREAQALERLPRHEGAQQQVLGLRDVVVETHPGLEVRGEALVEAMIQGDDGPELDVVPGCESARGEEQQ